MGVRSFIKKSGFLYRIAIWIFRFNLAVKFSIGEPRASISWFFRSREYTNFTYDLDPINRRSLAYYGASLCDVSVAEMLRYFEELEKDRELSSHLATTVANHEFAFSSDSEVRYGKRLLYYGVTRVLKPQVVVESGIEKGLASCVISAALIKNSAEGGDGRLIAIDIDDSAGWLISGKYAENVVLIRDSSHDAVSQIDGEVELFIYDSFGDPIYELEEYELIRQFLVDKAVVISKFGGNSTPIMDFADSFGGSYLSWTEIPKNHPYPGSSFGGVVFRIRD